MKKIIKFYDALTVVFILLSADLVIYHVHYKILSSSEFLFLIGSSVFLIFVLLLLKYYDDNLDKIGKKK